MAHDSADGRATLVRRGFVLEGVTLGWNVVGVAVLAVAAVSARSVALAGFGVDSLIEIGASALVIWQMASPDARQQRALRGVGVAFALLALYLAVQSSLVLARGFHAGNSRLGLAWTAATVLVMAGLAAGKEHTGRRLENPVLRAEGRVTLIDAVLGAAVFVGLLLQATLGWWWANPVAGYVLLFYGVKEAAGAWGLAQEETAATDP